MSTQFQPLHPNEAVDLKKFGADKKGIEALIAHLEAITAPAHSAEDHSFTDPENRGVCTVCGWIHPDVPAICEQHTVVHHLKELAETVRVSSRRILKAIRI